jgi:hypothetical protein
MAASTILGGGTMSRFSLALGALSASLFIASSTGAAVIGNDFYTTTIYDINTSTGAATNPRPTGLTSPLAGITFGPGGTLYGLTTISGAQPNSLVTINTTTGAASVVGSTGLNTILEGDLAFSPGGTLYGVQQAVSGRQLFTINTATGAGTLVGVVTTTGDLSAMSFAPSGSLYMLDTINDLLLTVNPATAAITGSVALSTPLGDVAGFTYDSSLGQFLVADGDVSGTDSLYTLNVTTGLLTLIGPTGLAQGLAGLASDTGVGVAVPVPAAAYGGLALLGLVAYARRRRVSA